MSDPEHGRGEDDELRPPRRCPGAPPARQRTRRPQRQDDREQAAPDAVSCSVAPNCRPITWSPPSAVDTTPPRSPRTSGRCSRRTARGRAIETESARIASFTASLTCACGPSMTSTGSPGMTRSARNATVAAPHRTSRWMPPSRAARRDATRPAGGVVVVRRPSCAEGAGSVDADVVEQRAPVQIVGRPATPRRRQ